MKKIILVFVFIFVFCAGAAYAGQEQLCNHNSYKISYDSDKEIVCIFCNNCGESHKLKVDSFFVEKLFTGIWEE